jgi:hypothetical protein
MVFFDGTSACGACVTIVGSCVGVPQEVIYYLQLLLLGVNGISLLG